jgi:hypothetical protein
MADPVTDLVRSTMRGVARRAAGSVIRARVGDPASACRNAWFTTTDAGRNERSVRVMREVRMA